MDIQEEILKTTCQLYSNLNLSRTDIQFVIEMMQNLITNIYNPFLYEKLSANLHNAINDEVHEEIKKTFKKWQNPFLQFNREDKRLTYYKKNSLLLGPEYCSIATKEITTSSGKKLLVKDQHILMAHIPLNKSLKNLLEIDGVYNAVIEYMEFLNNDKTAITNFVQGQLWQKQKSTFDKTGIALPLFGYFDDVETGNSLGFHAKNNEIGAVYVTLPCFPPNFASKLESIILSDIFYSNDRQQYGNAAIFKRFIEELNDLRENGIDLIIKEKNGSRNLKVYFITSLILGENLGINSIFGFTSSFSRTVWCRICYAKTDVMQTLVGENESLLRTATKYKEDVQIMRFCDSGIKEDCIFNVVKDFDVIENSSVDVMHDVYEGVCNYVIAEILLKLVVEDKILNLDYINYRMRSLDFSFESSNLPPPISLDYLKNNRKLKMSASESLFFARYFGVILGGVLDYDNVYWKLYKKLRALIHFLTAPSLTYSHILQIETLISELNDMYIQLFGNLKPKFHLLIHYPKQILTNGPVSKFSSMRFESYHRIIKLILSHSFSHQQILKSISLRYVQSQMGLQFS
ncbi:LOW QUALITY PROTEIN: uncharacterized protein [Prorops nasuta]|uniref:LOW QUALITY PROTEIN: uncharacterized protein n=1 Tax=Prorops nasuta TaxID=863751 RepID=UPI0034CF1F90